MIEQHDNAFMRRAIELALRASGQTRPNPIVGAVIVREGRIIGEGWHERAGAPHAEINALSACVEDSRGATMYVTLEPCNHHGRTPPCVDALIDAGIARVVIGQRDPNPKAKGGAEKLRAHGVEVEFGVCAQEALLLNPGFTTLHMLGRPCVTLKWAMSADGCTSTASGHSNWISNDDSRGRVHQMRAESDAVLVGVETAVRDNARLTIRDAEVPPGPPLLRMVLDTNLRLPVDHALVREKQSPAIVVCGESAGKEAEARLVDAGAQVWRVAQSERAEVELDAVMQELAQRGVQSLLVEGGRRVAGVFVEAECVDRVAAFIAPMIIGSGATALSAVISSSAPIMQMQQAIRLHHAQWELIGNDALLHGWMTKHLFVS